MQCNVTYANGRVSSLQCRHRTYTFQHKIEMSSLGDVVHYLINETKWNL
jgi:hypothetical protein